MSWLQISRRFMTGKLQYDLFVRLLKRYNGSLALPWPIACTGSQRLLGLNVLMHLQIGPARQVRSYPEPSGPRERGFVERFKEHYGFIRCFLATCC